MMLQRIRARVSHLIQHGKEMRLCNVSFQGVGVWDFALVYLSAAKRGNRFSRIGGAEYVVPKIVDPMIVPMSGPLPDQVQ
jgi:hypothetical protein